MRVGSSRQDVGGGLASVCVGLWDERYCCAALEVAAQGLGVWGVVKFPSPHGPHDVVVEWCLVYCAMSEVEFPPYFVQLHVHVR